MIISTILQALKPQLDDRLIQNHQEVGRPLGTETRLNIRTMPGMILPTIWSGARGNTSAIAVKSECANSGTSCAPTGYEMLAPDR
jgi:hypothetical protein